MARIEKTIFISYRRKDISWALAVYQYFTSQKYDVFFDYTSIPSGDFEQIIVSNIKGRAHFILILTPTALDRCSEPEDWLRREIETAIDEKRNIIPLFFDGFSFGSPSVAEKLTGKLSTLNHYNGLDIPSGYFVEAMERLRSRYLNVPLNAVLHPVPTEVRKVVKQEQNAVERALAHIEDIKDLIKPIEKSGKQNEENEVRTNDGITGRQYPSKTLSSLNKINTNIPLEKPKGKIDSRLSLYIILWTVVILAVGFSLRVVFNLLSGHGQAPFGLSSTPTVSSSISTSIPLATDVVPIITITSAPSSTRTKIPSTDTPVYPTSTIPPSGCNKLFDAPAAPAAGVLGSAENPIVITFVPSGDTERIAKAGGAIADCLSQQTGLNFKMEVGVTFAASIEAMGAEKAQVSFMNTFSILLAEQKYGVIPALVAIRKYSSNDVDPDQALAGQFEPFYRGQFIAGTDKNINSFADLRGRSFCFVDPNSASGYIVPRIILKANGIDPDMDFSATQNAGSHNNVAIAVYSGDCDAGVTFINVLTDPSANLVASYPDIADKVKPFAVTDRIPNDGMQFIKGLDPELQAVIVEGVLAMTRDPGGKAVLKSLYNYDSMEAVRPDFYNDFAAILQKAGVDPATLVK